MIGRPVLAASERAKVLFPDPAMPDTITRQPIVKAASVIDVSVPQLVHASPLAREARWDEEPQEPGTNLSAAPASEDVPGVSPQVRGRQRRPSWASEPAVPRSPAATRARRRSRAAPWKGSAS